MVIAFWNINQKKNSKKNVELSDTLIDFVSEHGIDILFLAEVNDTTRQNFLIKAKLKFPTRPFSHIVSSNARTTLLSSYATKSFQDLVSNYISPRWDSFLLEITGIVKLNLISVHFHSKINWSESSLALECANFARHINFIEKQTGCTDTILIGDFNMNPFEDGMVAANGLHAIQDLDYSFKTKKGRKIDGNPYPYFYNPMWNFFGDFQKPLGTHYHRTSGHISQEWNTYDQVIFRPSIKNYLDTNYIKIIDKIGLYKLTGSYGRPNDRDYSDHLPILLKLKV